MPKVDYLKMKQDLNDRLSRYELSAVAETLRSLDKKLIPSLHLVDFAKIARGAHLYKEAIAILQDAIYGVRSPSTDLLLEYATSLRRMGMVNQCLHLLQRAPDHPAKSLHEAYCYIHLWNYARAQTALEDYLSNSYGNERERLAAQLNLISCYIFQENFDTALALIGKIELICQKKYHQFYLNLLEMTGQIYIAKKKFSQASIILKNAFKLAKTQTAHTTLFIEKWQLIAQAQLENGFREEELLNFKKKIRAQAHWETLRDIDYQIGLATQDSALINTAYFGTPFVEFKNRIRKKTPRQLANTFLWHPSAKNSPITSLLDPLDTQFPLATFGLIQHRLLLALMSDFYRPQSVARIFDSLFPQEIFDPQSSAKRIYALIHKLQATLAASGLPYEILSTIHGYRLRNKEGGAILIYEKMVFTSPKELLYQSLNSKYHLHHFTPRHLSEILQVSSHKAYRWINELKEHDLVFATAKGYNLKAA